MALPEMFSTGFSMEADRVSEPSGGETETFLREIAKEFSSCFLGGVAVRAENGSIQNQALVLAPDGALLARYSKQRLFSPGEEDKHYVPGDQVVTFTWSGIQVAPMICYDLRFPELFRRATAQCRPELFVLIANWLTKRIHHWGRLLQARAIENQSYVLAVNRVGSDPFVEYPGHSLVIDPHGEILGQGGSKPECLHAALDIAALRKYREGLPFLADLRP